MKVYIFLKHYTSKILFFEINNAVFLFCMNSRTRANGVLTVSFPKNG